MIKEVELNVGDKVFWKDAEAPMKVVACNARFVVCTRKLSKKHDNEVLESLVENQSYSSKKAAYEACKDYPIYTIIDFKERVNGPHNIIFNPYDFKDQESLDELMADLESGETEVSAKRGVPLNLDVVRTNEANKQ